MCVVSVFGGQHSCLYCCCVVGILIFTRVARFACLLNIFAPLFFFNMDTFCCLWGYCLYWYIALCCVGVGGGGGAGLCVGFY